MSRTRWRTRHRRTACFPGNDDERRQVHVGDEPGYHRAELNGDETRLVPMQAQCDRTASVAGRVAALLTGLSLIVAACSLSARQEPRAAVPTPTAAPVVLVTAVVTA